MGFRDKWNIDCLKSGIGDGLIFSPINMDSDKLLALPKSIREVSFLDPQFYLLNKEKARGSASLLPSHGRGIWPRDVLKKVSRGLSRVEAGNPGFPRLVQVTSGGFSWWL